MRYLGNMMLCILRVFMRGVGYGKIVLFFNVCCYCPIRETQVWSLSFYCCLEITKRYACKRKFVVT